MSCLAQPLACRMLSYERLELGDQRGVMTEREVGLDAVLERDQPQLLEPRDLVLRERLVGEIGQRRPAPERERGSCSVSRRPAGRPLERLRPSSASRLNRSASGSAPD